MWKITFSVLLVGVAFTMYNVSAQSKNYKVGDRGPAGGYIFYDKGNYSDGWRYLEAAISDFDKKKEWGCDKKTIQGAQGTAIGTGKSNTQAIVNNCGGVFIAAKSCTNYHSGGKQDWFLPSKDELNLMYKVLHKAGIGNFAGEFYWSSSEFDEFRAWAQNFKDGEQDSYGKRFLSVYGPMPVRAVRAF